MEEALSYDALNARCQVYRSRLRKQLLLDIYNDHPLHGGTRAVIGEYYGYQFGAGRLNILIVKLVDRRDLCHGQAYRMAEQIINRVLLFRCPEGETCIVKDFLVCLIEEPENPEARYDSCFSALKQAFYGVALVMGSGFPCENLTHLRDCFDSAITALQYGVAVGYGRRYSMVRLHPERLPIPEIAPGYLELLRVGLRQRDERTLTRMVLDLFEEYRGIFSDNPPAAYLIPQSLAQYTDQYARTLPGHGQLHQHLSELDRCTSVEEEQQLFLAAFQSFCGEQPRLLSTACGSALAYLSEHYTESVTLEQLGQLTGLHPRYLGNLFRRETGETVTQYIRRRRLTLARTMLVGTSLSVSEISQAVGYQDYRYLCRLFERELGKSPGEYRRTVLAAQQETAEALEVDE